jgi:HD-GYP domain-containing protein (c-di-GMP phosphodiesterase class II)
MLRAPIYEDRDDSNLLLLAAGTMLTATLLTRLEQRGVSFVRMHPQEVLRLTASSATSRLQDTAASEQLRQALRKASSEQRRTRGQTWALSDNSFVHEIKRHKPSTYQPTLADSCRANYHSSVTQVESLLQGIRSGQTRHVDEFHSVSAESLVRLAEDLDLFVGMGLKPAADRYPYKHSLQTMMLALSMGTTLGLPYHQLVELGIGCLMHDAGMLKLQRSLLGSSKPFTQVEFIEVTRHPIVSFDMLREIPGVPHGAHMVVYQMHERCDGSGYPRGRTARQIHPLAKIAAVADVFVAMISPRPHRPGMLPYHAMEQVLYGAQRGLFDREVVRALLKTISLFPIGSNVELSDGRLGRVLRANTADFSRPVVELWEPEDLADGSEVVDLSRESALQVIRPLADLTAV